ncbi:hypothetical protein NR798_24200 [Archangium gephyra]|uniref:hypothetical protein n=1 Tax=Archangium gephyra TaxID=48 RepID=UPI0035D4943B
MFEHTARVVAELRRREEARRLQYLAADPDLTKAVEDEARQSLRVLDLQATAKGLDDSEGSGPWMSQARLEAHSAVSRAQALLSKLDARVRHERGRALSRRMAKLEVFRAASQGTLLPGPPVRGNVPVQLGLFPGESTPTPRGPRRPKRRQDRHEHLPATAVELPAGEDRHEQLPATAVELPAGEDLHEQLPATAVALPAGEDLHEQLPATAVALPAGEDLDDEEATPRCGQCGVGIMADEMRSGLCDECRPVAEEMGIAGDYAGEDLHDQLPESDLVIVDELPASWCEGCTRTRPGTQWNQRRSMRLCPTCWPAEELRRGAVAA